MFQDLVNDFGILDACDYFHCSAALLAFLSIYCEDALKSLCPGLSVATGFVRALILGFRGHHFSPQFAVRGEHPMKSRQVHIHAWGALYDQLSGTLICELGGPGHSRITGLAEAGSLLASADEERRRAAWTAINASWELHEESCAAAINSIAGWRLELCSQRSRQKTVHFLDAPVHQNKISNTSLNALLKAASDARELAQRAAKLQGRAYGKPGFSPWDLQAPAPVVDDTDAQVIGFDDAIEIIADAFGNVDPSMGEFVHMMAKNRWIEGTVGPRKRPGAYCTVFPKSRSPRVYMTYCGSQSDVITLAHELGHAFHFWVMRDMPDSQLDCGMSLAETASILGETMVRDALLAKATTPQQRLDILWEDVCSLTGFLLNIPARFEFERNFYEARSERPLRPAELKSLMSEAWQTWYGDSLTEPDPMFWASKLHYYISGLSFYNFPYLFGYLFSLGLYTRRGQFGAEFSSRYKAILRDSGRMTAEELAEKHLGVSLSNEEFWRDTIAGFAHKVDEFEALLDEIQT